MLTGETVQERQQATAWLGTLDQRLPGDIVKKVLGEELSFNKKTAANGPPWSGGALYLPRTEWNTKEAWDMSRTLICWMLWAEENDKGELAKQVSNNLRDLSWRNGIGFRSGGSGKDWAKALLKKAGKDEAAVSDKTDTATVILIVQLLEHQG